MKQLATFITIFQWIILTIIFCIGFIAVLIIFGEETPGKTMSLMMFCGSKFAAGEVLYLCVLAWKYFNRRGLLPEFKDLEEEEAGRED